MTKKTGWKVGFLICSLAILVSMEPVSVQAYSPEAAHRPLSSLALETFRACFHKDPFRGARERIIDGNAAMDEGMRNLTDDDILDDTKVRIFSALQRGVNWHFFNPEMTDTKFTERAPGFLGEILVTMLGLDREIEQSYRRPWDRLKKAFANAGNLSDKARIRSDRALYLGGLLHLLEDVSVPAHVIPVFHSVTLIRFIGDFDDQVDYLRGARQVDGLSIKDAIDSMPADMDKLAAHVDINRADFCKLVMDGPMEPDSIRDRLAGETLELTETSIPGSNCSHLKWNTFWTVKERSGNDYFGKYNLAKGHPLFNKAGSIPGPAGTPECKFTDGDNAYSDFVFKAHLLALKADLRLLNWASTGFQP